MTTIDLKRKYIANVPCGCGGVLLIFREEAIGVGKELAPKKLVNTVDSWARGMGIAYLLGDFTTWHVEECPYCGHRDWQPLKGGA